MSFKYKRAILGGAFDFLHKGHEKLISEAFSNSEEVLIGVNSDEFCRERGKNTLQDQDARTQGVENFLRSKDWSARAHFHVHDKTGCPAYTDPDIEAIIVSENTLGGAGEVNQARGKNGLSELETIQVSILKAEDGGPISSTRIRNGEIDREGTVYLRLFEKDLHMPDSLREELRKPLGEIITSDKFGVDSKFNVSIGDVATVRLIENGIAQSVSVFDLKTKRQAAAPQILEKLPKPDIKVRNDPGTISSAAVKSLNQAVQGALSGHRQAIEVEGEEDLLTLPAILLAPLSSTVFYGLPDVGGVLVHITEEKKEEAKKIVQSFSPS